MSVAPIVRDILIKGFLAGSAVKTAKKTTAGWGLYALAGGVGCVGFVFFAIAGYGFLLQDYPMHIAAAITGSVILLISIAIGLFGYYGMKKKKIIKKSTFTDGGMAETIESTFKSFLEGFEEPVKDNPKMALLMAALAGFAAGDKLH